MVQALQRIHEWRASFGSTAITVLMAFFASKPEYQTQAAHKEFAVNQLEDSCFVYEDPDNEDHPGAFLSEYILCIFTAHLNVIAGNQKIDTLESGMPCYETALALMTAAVSLVDVF
ncbi:uncharacterized protein EDB91DRAFT_1052473 [Suillus paluster]|uniref:uncharacterized protein n=1 Tax=Suillus paluster TaxID=48578 RepID=UPI001B87B96B|nr:uncharacterized protein EDB91DRAFT_1052473 [Suillus paluster]KAG1741479.1 hypothetical protein EDB91DRAFT_1052473 [Suillus paluster]